MNIVRWDPFEDMMTLRRSMDRLLDDALSRRPRGDGGPAWEPAVEMFETDHEVVVRTELPNIDPKQIDITVTNDAITLRGQTKQEEERKGRNYYVREVRYGAFSRTLPVLTEVKGDEAQATYKDGILEVKIPKSERVKPTSVKVKVE